MPAERTTTSGIPLLRGVGVNDVAAQPKLDFFQVKARCFLQYPKVQDEADPRQVHCHARQRQVWAPLLPRAPLHAAISPRILFILIKNVVPLALDSDILAERIVPLWSCSRLALLNVGEYY